MASERDDGAGRPCASPGRRAAAGRDPGGPDRPELCRGGQLFLARPRDRGAGRHAYADLYVQDILASNADSVGQTNAWMRTRLEELQAQAQAAAGRPNALRREQPGRVLLGGLLTEQALNETELQPDRGPDRGRPGAGGSGHL